MNKKMPKEELIQEIRNFLNARKVLVLCTCSDNIPRATPMDFYMEKNSSDFTLYICPTPGRKVENIKKNPIVSIGIYTPMDSGKIQGMQITASGKERLIFLEEGDPGFKDAKKCIKRKCKLILKIIPEKIELLDYDFIKKGYARLQALTL
ncbi:MAG: pyridoxamine 5'-phosphate oxidase family protein [Promethearchaeota archaeon]